MKCPRSFIPAHRLHIQRVRIGHDIVDTEGLHIYISEQEFPEVHPIDAVSRFLGPDMLSHRAVVMKSQVYADLLQ